MSAMKLLAFSALWLLTVVPAHAQAKDDAGAQNAYIVLDYRFDPAGGDGDADTGHALCATRCNALSFNYADYVMADPREVQRIATDRELTLPLDNPFMKGNCICTVDEYIIKPNVRNQPR